MEAASDSKIINMHRCNRHRELGSCDLYKNVYLVAESYTLLIDRDIINNICYKAAVPSLSTIIEITLNFSGAGTDGIVGGELHREVFVVVLPHRHGTSAVTLLVPWLTAEWLH